jgi:hypothetical protein
MTALLQENPSLCIKKKDVNNEILKARQLQLGGRTPIEALIEQLKDPDQWVFDYQIGINGELTYLFLAYLKPAHIFESHPDILMADCTYRTNRFKMPLLHFIGRNSIGSHYTIAFCFHAWRDSSRLSMGAELHATAAVSAKRPQTKSIPER